MAGIPPFTPGDYYSMSPIPEPEMRRRPARAKTRRRRLLIAAAVAGALVVAGGAGTAVALTRGADGQEASAQTDWSNGFAEIPGALSEALATAIEEIPEPQPEPEESEETDTDHDVDSPDSLTVVVNKQRPLDPIDWAPDDLVMPSGIENANGQPMRTEAAQALEQMHAEASAEGLPFFIASAYRDYGYQTTLFDDYVARDGVEAAETYSARPGHSEHQLGLAVDLVECSGCALGEAFGETEVGLWLRENAHRFGFILRYDQGEEPVVGYVYEPWHFRYVGTDVATEMHDSGEKNLETFLGLDPAPTY